MKAGEGFLDCKLTIADRDGEEGREDSLKIQILTQKSAIKSHTLLNRPEIRREKGGRRERKGGRGLDGGGKDGSSLLK